MSLERSSEFVGKHPGLFGKREPCSGIEAYIIDFMAKVAVDAFSSDSLDGDRIGVEGIIDRGRGSMAGGAVAGVVWKIEFVPRPVIGFFRIRRKRNKHEIIQAPIAVCRAPAA
jgi:hypothetical protein